MTEKSWNIGGPGGPAGPFYSVVKPDGQIVAMQILTQEMAELIASIPQLQAEVERLQAVVDAADELTHVVLHRLPAVAPEDTVAVIRAADDYRELRGASQ